MVDLNLILECKNGNHKSFELLYKTYITKTIKTIYLIVGKKCIIDDIVQEVFYQCYRDIIKLQNPHLFEIWFYKLIVRTCWRTTAGEKKFLHETFDEKVSNNLKFSTCDILYENRLSIINQAIDKLSITMKTTIILYYFNDMSIKQISQIMNCFQGTTKSRLHNAKKILKAELIKSKEMNE